MIDAYIASQPLVSDPGQVQQYSSLGYYLLGRVVLKLRGGTDLANALQDNLLDFLGITRIRAAVDLVADQPSDEARYQAASFGPSPLWVSDLPVAPSLMTPDQPLVAAGYGDDEIAVGGGGGGLSGAATDVARLVAILLNTKNNSALKRVTLEQMLSQGAVLGAAQQSAGNPDPRAGFGLDGVQWQSPGVYYGQKGGLIIDAAAVFQFDGQWGFVALFGSSANRPNGVVYPNWPDVMKIAKADLATATDLFPQFGMPSL
jgi:CubicO group peptidase (beta-lactamase class C family)